MNGAEPRCSKRFLIIEPYGQWYRGVVRGACCVVCVWCLDFLVWTGCLSLAFFGTEKQREQKVGGRGGANNSGKGTLGLWDFGPV